MSIQCVDGFVLPTGLTVELAGRDELYLPGVQTALVAHLVAARHNTRVRCACSEPACPRWLIPFHEPCGKIGLRRERVTDGHPVTCISHREREVRETLAQADFLSQAGHSGERTVSVARFCVAALRNASLAYVGRWTAELEASGFGRVRPSHFFPDYVGRMDEMIVTGGERLGHLLAQADLELLTGVLEQLPEMRARSAEGRIALSALVWTLGGFVKLPLAVEDWLLDCLRRSISVYGQTISGPYLFTAVVTDGLVINMWVKPLFISPTNLGLMDSGCERNFAGHIEGRGLSWYKPPTMEAVRCLPRARLFWDFDQCSHRFDFAVFADPRKAYVVETTSFDLGKHLDYAELIRRRLEYFKAITPRNGFAVQVLSRSAEVTGVDPIPLEKAIVLVQPSLDRLAAGIMAVLQ